MATTTTYAVIVIHPGIDLPSFQMSAAIAHEIAAIPQKVAALSQ